MLVLIPGITGNVGQHIAQSLISRGHTVRGLGRSPSKLSPSITSHSSFDSFVTSTSYYDISALDKACDRVDAIICAYLGIPTLQLEGQLLLLRAAERAGIKKFVAATWNYDWRKVEFGEHESYDPYLMFRRQVELTSEIKPCYILSGVYAEVLFSKEGHGDFSPKNHGMWDPEKKEMQIWGKGEEKWCWTTERDAAEFAAEIATSKDAANGGFWSVCSGKNTLKELAEAYGKNKGFEVSIAQKGSEEDLEKEAMEARANGSPTNYWGYIGYFYTLFTVNGRWDLEGDVLQALPGVKRTELGKWLRETDGI